LNTDELKAKRANADRIREFSKKLRDFNKEAITVRAPSPIDTNTPHPRHIEQSARSRALEFAKNVPKPKIRKEQNILVHGDTGSAEKDKNNYGSVAEENYLSWDHNAESFGDDSGLNAAMAAVLGGGKGGGRLHELEQKHGDNQRKVDAIKRSLGL
jgi:hypothetical protein